MKRNLHRLASETFDLLVIGGGINGVATAWDAAQRGLSVALIEKDDYGAQASAGCYRILHGGLRYLQHLDLGRVRESIAERRAMMRIAPHLNAPIGFLVPTYPGLMKGRAAMSAALAVNDLLSASRNRGITDPSRHLPDGRTMGADEALRLCPAIPADGLTGAALFYDGMMMSCERLCALFARAAAAAGACCANHVEASSLILEEGRAAGAEARDLLSGRRFAIRARVVANVTGPWANRLVYPDRPFPKAFSAGLQIVTAPLFEISGLGVAFTSRQEDPDSRMSRGGRHLFAVPWRGRLTWGTTDTLYEGDPADWRITTRDIEAFVRELDACLPGRGIDMGAVQHAFGGLRPVDERNLMTGSQVSRRYEIFDHANDPGIGNLFSMIGVKFTVGRSMAEKLVDLVFGKLGRKPPRCRTQTTPLPGGEFETFEKLVTLCRTAAPRGMTEPEIEETARLYGSEAPAILSACRPTEDPFDRLGLIAARAAHGVKHEGAATVDDLVQRRLAPVVPGDALQWRAIAAQALDRAPA